ncbi:MAG TPA: tRNA (N6-threonylcarbamoyladenosine(37)-N6)-methyltransferase TrmO [Candidatus Wallbacteria bacterium]|nr:tRNA (N6-threonylcarbamoyladenosine(37)-N6)-methyltransferase TrmO [Candidatus Wallbacteria bacterium]
MFEPKTYSFEQIGVVRRPGGEEHVEWNDLQSESKIELNPKYVEALDGLEEYSHIIIFFVFHKRTEKKLKIHPEERDDMPEVGVFCTNSYTRPNPIAMSVVKIKNIDKNVITIIGLDALDGTPVIDIKPFNGFDYEGKGHKIPDWLKKLWEE